MSASIIRGDEPPERDMGTGQLAVVTGASSGIGLELAKQFARHGFDLLIVAEDEGIVEAAGELRTSRKCATRPCHL